MDIKTAFDKMKAKRDKQLHFFYCEKGADGKPVLLVDDKSITSTARGEVLGTAQNKDKAHGLLAINHDGELEVELESSAPTTLAHGLQKAARNADAMNFSGIKIRHPDAAAPPAPPAPPAAATPPEAEDNTDPKHTEVLHLKEDVEHRLVAALRINPGITARAKALLADVQKHLKDKDYSNATSDLWLLDNLMAAPAAPPADDVPTPERADEFKERLRDWRPKFDQVLAQAKEADAAWAEALEQSFAQMLHEVQKKQFAKALETMDRLTTQMKGKEYARAVTKSEISKADPVQRAWYEEMRHAAQTEIGQDLARQVGQDGYDTVDGGATFFARAMTRKDWCKLVSDPLMQAKTLLALHGEELLPEVEKKLEGCYVAAQRLKSFLGADSEGRRNPLADSLAHNVSKVADGTVICAKRLRDWAAAQEMPLQSVAPFLEKLDRMTLEETLVAALKRPPKAPAGAVDTLREAVVEPLDKAVKKTRELIKTGKGDFPGTIIEFSEPFTALHQMENLFEDISALGVVSDALFETLARLEVQSKIAGQNRPTHEDLEQVIRDATLVMHELKRMG